MKMETLEQEFERAEKELAGTETGEVVSNVTAAPAPIKLTELEPMELGDRIEHIKLSDILLDETDNIRRFSLPAKDIKDLAQDIVKVGQIVPILVRPVKHQGKKMYRPIEGFQRTKAFVYINDNLGTFGLTEPLKIAATVVDLTDAQARNTAISTFKRKDLSPIDIGSFIIQSEADYGWTRKDIAQRIGRHPSQVTEMAQMAGQLRVSIQKRVHAGELPYGVARELLGMTEEDQDKQLAAYDKTGGDRDAVKAVKRKTKNKKGQDVSIQLSIKEIKQLVKSLAGVIEYAEDEECPYSEKVQKIGKLMDKAIAGKMGETALANQLDKLC